MEKVRVGNISKAQIDDAWRVAWRSGVIALSSFLLLFVDSSSHMIAGILAICIVAALSTCVTFGKLFYDCKS